MTTTDLTRDGLATPLPSPATNRASLLRLSLVRGLVALAWAACFARVHESPGLLAAALLVAYPLIDAVASLVDWRAMARGAERRATGFNAVLSALAAVALGAVGGDGPAAVLAVFGVWAGVAGAAQFVLGLHRRGLELGKQWPMLISGGLSFLVGITYCIQAAGAKPSLAVLAVYATGGGVFFVVQAGLLAWRSQA